MTKKSRKERAEEQQTEEESAEETAEQEAEQAETPTEAQAEEGAELSETEKLTALAEDYKRKWYSVSAEYDNFRKRNASAVAKAYSDGVAEAVLKLLPVADNFGYALSSARDEKTKAGIDKIIKNFNAILSSFGIEEIKISEGDDFDESVAEAIMSQPCGKGDKPNKIKTVLRKGYKQGEKVIRFAQVAVTV